MIFVWVVEKEIEMFPTGQHKQHCSAHSRIQNKCLFLINMDAIYGSARLSAATIIILIQN